VLFSAAGMLAPDSMDTEAGRELHQSRVADYHVRYQNAYLEYVRVLLTGMPVVNREADFVSAFKAQREPGSQRAARPVGDRVAHRTGQLVGQRRSLVPGAERRPGSPVRHRGRLHGMAFARGVVRLK